MRRWYLTLAAVWTVLGTIPLLVRMLDVGAPVIVFARLAFAAAALGAAVAATSATGPRLFSWRPGLCLATGATLAVHWASLFAAYDRAPAGTVILVVYLAPVGVAVAAPLLLRERVRLPTVAALLVAVAGFLLVAAPAATTGAGSFEGADRAAAAAFTAVATLTFVALVLLSKPLAEVYGGLRTAFVEMVVAAVLIAPLAVRELTRDGAPRPAASWWWLVVLGLVHTAVAHGLYLAALARLPATDVAILGYLEPVSVVVCAWLVLHERPSPATLAGGALIVAAGVAVVRFGARTPEVATDVPG